MHTHTHGRIYSRMTSCVASPTLFARNADGRGFIFLSFFSTVFRAFPPPSRRWPSIDHPPLPKSPPTRVAYFTDGSLPLPSPPRRVVRALITTANTISIYATYTSLSIDHHHHAHAYNVRKCYTLGTAALTLLAARAIVCK